ncbi:MAG: hypothetical protein WBB60_09135 [Nitrospira sp.]|jgi:hypothetical protein|nr:hypothetical protein [Nitrospira sp.]MBP6605230.1 hypothetical protein [Nitrospira sp.]MCI1278069.1 hypothetical protein [Nitrospira sp.]HQY57182.1 hypothetical protein [Nitrospira sp.]HRA96044.1 hypothetical protein [Nitrospira sp.]
MDRPGIHAIKSTNLAFMSIGLVALALQGCGHASRPPEATWPEPSSGEISLHRAEHAVLAGEWEYEESGMVVPLRLDQFGNGFYDFKDGRFRTDILSDRHWTGAWAQRENNREGGFEITLSSDYSEGEGRWWYTRIEGDTAPTNPGGRFHVLKVQSIVENQGSRSAPSSP